MVSQTQRRTIFSLAVSLLAATSASSARLEVHPTNPRWLTLDNGQTATVLTGAHTWSIFQDYEGDEPFPAIKYMRGIADLGHNFTRGWFWEDGYYSPLPYVLDNGGYRLSGPYSQRYLARLRQRIKAARKRGLITSVMLFQGWSMDTRSGFRDPDPWPRHPYNRANTSESVSKQQAALHIGLAQQQQLDYVSFVARKLCREPNIIWEISNETHSNSLGSPSASNWQNNILSHLQSECGKRPTWVSCPIQTTMSSAERQQMTDVMMGMSSDIVTPCRPTVEAVVNPEVADGRKVIIADTDHFDPDDVSPEWVWKAFLRGQHPIFMDLTGELTWWEGDQWDPTELRWKRVRRALGEVQELVAAVEKTRSETAESGLGEMAPQAKPGGRPGHRTRPTDSPWALYSSNRPCPKQKSGACKKARANGEELLIYAEPGSSITVCRLEKQAKYSFRWKKTTRRGYLGASDTAVAGGKGCLKLKNPSDIFAVVHIEKSL
jgi:hypothetical protein